MTDRGRQSTLVSQTGSGLVARYPLAFFYALALLFSAVIVGVLLVVGLAKELFVLGTFGPGIAAVITVGVLDGRSQAWRFVKGSLNPKFGLGWWAIAILLPLVVTVLALVLATTTGGPSLNSELWSGLAAAVPLLLMLTLLNGIPEEIAWRGFMLPLTQRDRSAFIASLIVGFWWGLWHAPLLFVEGTFQATLGEELGLWLTLGFWTLSTMIFSIGFTWLFNSTGGNSLAASVLHGAVNTWISWALVDATSSESIAMFAWFVGLWVVVAAFLLLTKGADSLTRSGHRIVTYVDRSAAENR
ncbi:MAG: CPBP family intramembrane metalloprotease [Acidimicrobiia bacterium]|nr:CPBP family intramembrane metalloprotease [Acidimicrobiia bacterium]